MRRLLLLSVVFLAAGCSGGAGDSGDIEAANKAAAVPKSADQLPANMAPAKRSEAVAGIGSQQAMTSQMNSQAAAMKAAQARAH